MAAHDRRSDLPEGAGSATPTWPPPPDHEPIRTLDPHARIDVLMRDLATTEHGISTREAAIRRKVHGTNVLISRKQRQWPRHIVRQLTHPLALLLWAACVLATIASLLPIAAAVLVVILVNAAFAVIQERQAEQAVEALKAYLPHTATVMRNGVAEQCNAADLVPGDVIVIADGDRISADARLLSGAVEIDLAALTGESQPVMRSAGAHVGHVPLQEARDVVFSGTACTQGAAHAVVFATGMSTRIGRIAALSERVTHAPSPLEQQVRAIARLISVVAIVSGVAFVPVAMLLTGLPARDAMMLAIGLIVGNVPEGLLPVITLALAVGVRSLARRGAIVKRLSSVETLGSTDVICTDKTGTLTENRMQCVELWTPVLGTIPMQPLPNLDIRAQLAPMIRTMVLCTHAQVGNHGVIGGDPTEIGILQAAYALHDDELERPDIRAERRALFHFDPVHKLMSTVDVVDRDMWVHTKGAPESVLERCTLTSDEQQVVHHAVSAAAEQGYRVLAVASRPVSSVPHSRSDAEHALIFRGLVVLHDPPRPEVAQAVSKCHEAGIRVIMVTGDHPLTAAAIALDIGISTTHPRVVTEAELDQLTDAHLDELLVTHTNLVFARSTPEAKLRIAGALHALGHVVAMTGDGVNDAPALRRADIGIAMGKSGTEVAREAATMVLADDNFSTIVEAIRTGRVIYANIRKFITYIFAHLTPEIVPFLVFALSGGQIPLPLTIMQLLAFEIGTETLPALALGREPEEPGVMQQAPRPQDEPLVRVSLLWRTWGFLGVIAATLQMLAFMHVLLRAGWTPGADVGPGSSLHHVYQQATTVTLLSMVAAQVGTAYASRTERASLREVGVLSNPLLLWGIGFELVIAALITTLPPLQHVLGTAVPDAMDLALIATFPVIVWGADEIRKYVVRRRA